MKRLIPILGYGATMLCLVWILDGGSPLAMDRDEEHASLPPIISLRDFWANAEDTYNYKISPDGQQLAWIGAANDNPTIFFENREEGIIEIVRADRPITDFWWTQDSRHIFFSWDEHGDENWHLLMADTQNPDAPYVDLTPYPGVRSRVQQVFPLDPAHILIKLNLRDPKVFDLYKLNLHTREKTLVFENPGDVGSWITNAAGEVLGRLRAAGSKAWSIELYRKEKGVWETTFSGDWDDEWWIIGYPKDVHAVWAISNRGRDRKSLVRIDLETGAETVVYEEPDVDLLGAWTDRGTYELRSAWSFPDFARVKFFDEAVERDIERFRKGSDGRIRNVWVASSSRDDRFWTVGVSSDTQGYASYLLDREKQVATLLARGDLARFASRFSPMEPIEFTARDGMGLRGYLTIPTGSSGKNLPLVVRVHDGPWSRDVWGYDHEIQLLANRGYAVLQVNYRGSRGYGRRFMEAGKGEFGGRMHLDILDGVRWVVGTGVADPARVAIYGWGYGGYEALVGLAFTPKEFAAGVAAAAPSDWEATIASMPPYWTAGAPRYARYVGDPNSEEGRAALRASSPIHKAEAITRPLLIVQGANDSRGIVDQAERLVSTLRDRDASVEYLLFPDEGNRIHKWQNQLRYYRALESFLAAHLGGRTSPVHAIEMWIGLQ